MPPESVRASRVEHRLELHRVDHLGDSLAALAPGDAGHAAVEVEVLIRGQRAVDGDRLGDVADARAHRERRRWLTSKPATSARPALGASSVVSTRTVVVLPAPLGPSRPKTSPGATAKETPPTASSRSKRTTRSSTSSARLLAGDAHAPRLARRLERGLAVRTAPAACASSSRILRRTRLRVSHSSCSSLPSSSARWRTSSSWRSMWPERLAQQLAPARRGRRPRARSCARTSARASSAVSSVFSSSRETPSRSFRRITSRRRSTSSWV